MIDQRHGRIFSVGFTLLMLMFAPAASMSSWGDSNNEKKAEAPLGDDGKPDFKRLRSPILNTKGSIGRGKTIYIRICSECHGLDGKALMDVIADATDLTAPKLWYSGTTEGEIFRSIRDGAGVAMPPFRDKLKDERDMWHLANFIRSLWPASIRPKIVEDKKTGNSAEKGE